MSCTSRSENRFTVLVAQRRDVGVAGAKPRRVALRAADVGEQVAAAADRVRAARRVGRRRRRRQEAHGRSRTSRCALMPVSGVDRRRCSVKSFGVVANWHSGVCVALGLEQLVGDAHLDVVGLAGEQQQRLVLRLPAEARDGAVIAVAVRLTRDGAAGQDDVGPAADAQRALAWTRWRRLARIAPSGICSIRPAPNTGVGMRKITLLARAIAAAKSGWREPQPRRAVRARRS